MKLALIAGIVLVALVGIVVLVGFLLPVKHEAMRTANFHVPASQIWNLISNYELAPTWRTDVKSVEKIVAKDGSPIWREINKAGEVIEYGTAESIPEQKLVRKIVSETLPFGGQWEFRLSYEGSTSHLTIIEKGEVYNPVFRFVSKFIMGHTATIDQYMKALKNKLGDV